MSLRQEILNELKSMLKEEAPYNYGFSDLFSGIPKTNAYGYGSKYSICELALMEYYNEQDLTEAKERALYDYKMIGNQTPKQAEESLRKDLSIPGYLMSNPKDSERDKKMCLTKLKGLKKTPEPPKPQTCPDGTPAPDGDVSKCKVSPTPKPELKGSGCKPGSKFIGKNGLTSGPEIVTLQQVLTSAMLTGGKVLTQGIFDAKTEEVILNFQSNYGAKYAQKVKSELGRDFPLDKTDGCVGPKTACALLLYSRVDATIVGFNKAKCKARFGTAIDAGTIRESKNWADRTRESASTGLFERLVKDVSKKKVI